MISRGIGYVVSNKVRDSEADGQDVRPSDKAGLWLIVMRCAKKIVSRLFSGH
jgi:hypothetical protein